MMLSEIYLRLDLGRLWRGRDVFNVVAKLEGDIFRHKEGRKTLRFQLAGKSYFLKYHRGIGWLEIIKNIVQFRTPIISAKNEWQAIRFLEKHNIETMTLAGYGEKGLNPAAKQSFVITDDLSDTMSLEQLGTQWHNAPPSFATKKSLIEKLARISKNMHENGMNHRDFYLCHFLLDKRFSEHNTFTDDTRLSLIDLHRAMIRQHRHVEERWLVKDIGALYFSAMDVPLTQRDLFRFVTVYSGLNLRAVGSQQRHFWEKVQHRAKKMRFADQAAIDQKRNPIRAFLQGHNQLELPFSIQVLEQFYQCSRILRLLPGKRLVVEAKSSAQHIVMKIFATSEKGARELARENQGYQLAKQAGVTVPKLLFSADNQQGCLIVAYDYIDNGITLTRLAKSERDLIFPALLSCINSMHAYGIYQDDIHLDNFLLADKTLHLLDLGSIKKQRPGTRLSKRQSLKNMARLIAQFSFNDRAIFQYYLGKNDKKLGFNYQEKGIEQLVKLTGKAWRRRKKAYLKKCFRNCTMTNHHQSLKQRWAFRSEFLEGEAASFVANIEQVFAKGEMLKEGNSSTVIKTNVAGRDLVIKRYNMKNKSHFLRRCLRASRAAVSWRNANLLEFMGIATAKPLGFIENKTFGLRKNAYFICEYLPGQELSALYQQRLPTKSEAEQLKNLFSDLAQAKVSHGDLKASNFLISDKGDISLIDLDAMKEHVTKFSFKKALEKDKKRFLKNWSGALTDKMTSAIFDVASRDD